MRKMWGAVSVGSTALKGHISLQWAGPTQYKVKERDKTKNGIKYIKETINMR